MPEASARIYPGKGSVAEYLRSFLLQTGPMRKILLGDRNSKHRHTLKEIFKQLDESLRLDFAGNGHDILHYLAERPAEDLPDLIIFDPGIPFVGQGQLIALLKSTPRLARIPIVIWTDQAGSDYYEARASGYAVMSFLKPSLPGGWDLIAHKMLSALDQISPGHGT
jgi:CheY-like chemotaxis protein